MNDVVNRKNQLHNARNKRDNADNGVLPKKEILEYEIVWMHN